MLLMIPLTVDEVTALGSSSRPERAGKPFWRTFRVGDTMEGGGEDDRTPRYGAPAAQMLRLMFWWVTAPWNLPLSAALGVWLMFAPAVFGTQCRVADGGDLSASLFSLSP